MPVRYATKKVDPDSFYNVCDDRYHHHDIHKIALQRSDENAEEESTETELEEEHTSCVRGRAGDESLYLLVNVNLSARRRSHGCSFLSYDECKRVGTWGEMHRYHEAYTIAGES